MKKLCFFLVVFAALQTMAKTPPNSKTPGAASGEAPAVKQGIFKTNTVFEKGKKYYSEDNRYFFTMQEDGNFVVYKVSPFKAIWHTHTNGKAVKSCIFQGDGNLVLYDYNNKALWDASSDYANQKRDIADKIVKSSRYKGRLGGAGAELRMQNDGNLVIYYGDNLSVPFWSSNSFEKN